MGHLGDNCAMDESIAKNRWTGINLYLTALYGRPTKSSDLLRGLGLNEQSIASLLTLHWAVFSERVVAGLEAQYLEDPNGERSFYVVNHLYGLDGASPWAAGEIAEAMQVSPTRVRQIRTRALRRHKTAEQVALLEEILRSAANDCLNGPQQPD